MVSPLARSLLAKLSTPEELRSKKSVTLEDVKAYEPVNILSKSRPLSNYRKKILGIKGNLTGSEGEVVVSSQLRSKSKELQKEIDRLKTLDDTEKVEEMVEFSKRPKNEAQIYKLKLLKGAERRLELDEEKKQIEDEVKKDFFEKEEKLGLLKRSFGGGQQFYAGGPIEVIVKNAVEVAKEKEKEKEKKETGGDEKGDLDVEEESFGEEKQSLGLDFLSKYQEEGVESSAIISEKIEGTEDFIKNVNVVYPLITAQEGNTSLTLAIANIRYDTKTNGLVFSIIEASLPEDKQKVADKVKALIKENLEVDLSKVKNKGEARAYLEKKIEEFLGIFRKKLTDKENIILKYYIFKELLGFGKIDALMADPNIEDISCDGFGLPVFVYHRDPRLGELPTNITFEDKEDLDAYVLVLAQKCNKALSVAEPLLDGALADGSRVQATFGTDIAMKGSNFTIRKFTQVPLSPVHLMEYGTVHAPMLAYLWLLIENQSSVLVSGATATGKTTFLNVISMFIPPNMKVVSIEDTPELQLPLPNWIPEVARSAFGVEKFGEVSMFDLLKSALRQRPDYIIVGEVRGVEASVMFQGMATGHPGLGTIHASSPQAVIDRLTTQPISLPPALLQNLQLMLFIIRIKKGDKYLRRVGRIVEVTGYDFENKKLLYKDSWTWSPRTDTFSGKESTLLNAVAHKQNWQKEVLEKELLRRTLLLKWMKQNNIKDYRSVAFLINLYYTDRERLMSIISRHGSI